MNKQDLWNAWKKYRDKVEGMFVDDADLVQVKDMLSCSCLCGDEPVEGVRTNDKGIMWRWLMEFVPGFHSDFKFLDDVKNSIGEGMGPFSEALISVQRWNAESYRDDAVIWTQHAYDMYAEHWKW